MIPEHDLLRPFVDSLLRHSALSDDDIASILDLPVTALDVRHHVDLASAAHEPHVNIVSQGVLARFNQDREGHRLLTAYYLSGEVADLEKIVIPKAQPHFRTVSKCRVAQVPLSAIIDLIHKRPNIGAAFWRESAVQASVLEERMVSIGVRDASSRLCHHLCEFAVRTGAAEQAEVKFPFPFTQQDLGEALGMTPVHINRMVQSLRREDLLILAQGVVHLPDFPELARRGQFDCGYLQQSG